MTASEARRGRFITFEGGEGAGKTTQIRRLAERLAQVGVDVLVTREPGGTPMANAVRALLVSKAAMKSAPMFLEMFDSLGGLAAGETDAAALDAFKSIFLALGAPIDPQAEALLHFAARRDHWAQAIEPMLVKGRWVLCDRFADSTTAYQGAAGGVGSDFVEELGDLVLPGVAPDLTLLLDVEPEIGLERARVSRGETSRYEDKDAAYHQAVRRAFLDIAAAEPARVRIIDAAKPEADVTDAVWSAVAEFAQLTAAQT